MAVFAALFSAAIRKIIIAAAVFFAAGLFNISANAQYVSEATADVYQRPTFVRLGVDFSDPILTIIEGIRTASVGSGNDFGAVNSFIRRINDSDTAIGGETADTDNLGSTNLLQFGPSGSRREMALGDRFAILRPSLPTDITAYMYTATGNEFAFAENTGNPAATTGTGEFFLNTVSWEETTDITAAGGFVAVVCADGFTSDDMIICRPIDATDCGQNGRPDFWDGSMCVPNCPNNLPNIGTDGTTCIAATTPTLTCDAESTTGQIIGNQCTCRTGFTERVSPEMCAMPQTGNNSQPQKSDGKNHTGALIFGGLMIMGAIGYAIDGDVSPFNFAPDFGYRITESGYAANAGGRIDFRKDNWHLYQSADSDFHRNGSSEFRYTSGGKYKGDLFSASFSESVSGETADYNFALSANWTGGIWKISPVYRLHSEYEKGEFTTRNSLNLQSEFRYNNWQIRPSAGFRWENTDDFADSGKFRIDAIHRF